MTATWTHDAVLTIEPASAEVVEIRPNAKLMLVEHYLGQDYVMCADDQCPNGIEAAAVAYAQATDAAYLSREAS